MEDEYLRCPVCGGKMIMKERYSDGGVFYGCENFRKTGCRGTRNLGEGQGKKTIEYDDGRCIRCKEYPSGGSLSDDRLCPDCQADYDRY